MVSEWTGWIEQDPESTWAVCDESDRGNPLDRQHLCEMFPPRDTRIVYGSYRSLGVRYRITVEFWPEDKAGK